MKRSENNPLHDGEYGGSDPCPLDYIDPAEIPPPFPDPEPELKEGPDGNEYKSKYTATIRQPYPVLKDAFKDASDIVSSEFYNEFDYYPSNIKVYIKHQYFDENNDDDEKFGFVMEVYCV